MHHSQNFLKLVQEAKRRIREVKVDEVASMMSQNERFHCLDIREESEWNEGHIRGASHLGKGILERDIEAKIPDFQAKIVLYCGGGYRSALAADNLQKMGYTNVYSMDKGWRGWIAKKLPTE